MTLIEAFEQGNVADFGKPDRVVDTVLSKVFFFGDRVTKVYKHEKAFYGDLTDESFRKEFYTEDFYWNHFMSPEVYRKLVHEVDDFYIEMVRIDSEKTLTKLSLTGMVTPETMRDLTVILVQKLRMISEEHHPKLEALFRRGLLNIHLESLEDLRNFAYMADGSIPRAKTDQIVDLLLRKSTEESYFEDPKRHRISAAIDNNPDNIIIDNAIRFIDIMPPKENWKVADEYFTIVRNAVDGFVLSSDALGDEVYTTYFAVNDPIPECVTLIYEIRSGMIQWAHRTFMGQPDIAEKYRQFTERRVLTLQEVMKGV